MTMTSSANILNLCWRLHKRVECISFWLHGSLWHNNKQFLSVYSWTNQRTICRQYTFLLSSRNGATFSHAPTAFVSVCLYILWLSFLLYPACFKFNLILLVSFAEPKLITLLISFVWVSLSGLYWCNECWKVIYPALRDCKCTKYSEYSKAVTFQ